MGLAPSSVLHSGGDLRLLDVDPRLRSSPNSDDPSDFQKQHAMEHQKAAAEPLVSLCFHHHE